jgi:FKBP-type peptidyl-prolyl cis-trans isomerase 2
MHRTDAICLVVVVLIIISVISLATYNWYTEENKKSESKKQGNLVVRKGDTVTLDFTEYIWTRDENGDLKFSVFQTTNANIANDDTIPKSVTFDRILVDDLGNPIVRDPLTAIVGNDLSDELNPGFNEQVIGMRKGESKVVELPITEGYGDKNQDLIKTIPFLDQIPIYNSIDRVAFENEYPEEVPLETGLTFADHYWGWMIKIDKITNDTIVVKHEPTLNMEVAIFSWPATIVNISTDTGMIWLQHSPDNAIINTPIDAEVMEFYKPEFNDLISIITEDQQPYPGIITSTNNGITIDFNRENIGKKLKYEIKIVNIIRD